MIGRSDSVGPELARVQMFDRARTGPAPDFFFWFQEMPLVRPERERASFVACDGRIRSGACCFCLMSFVAGERGALLRLIPQLQAGRQQGQLAILADRRRSGASRKKEQRAPWHLTFMRTPRTSAGPKARARSIVYRAAANILLGSIHSKQGYVDPLFAERCR